jgi:hypothetical protein
VGWWVWWAGRGRGGDGERMDGLVGSVRRGAKLRSASLQMFPIDYLLILSTAASRT